MGLMGLPPLGPRGPKSPSSSGSGNPSAPSDPTSQAGQPPMGAPNSGSPFGGGLSGLMQSVQLIEEGAMQLAQQAPSLASLAAQLVSQLRAALPNALGAMANSQPGLMPPPPNGMASEEEPVSERPRTA